MSSAAANYSSNDLVSSDQPLPPLAKKIREKSLVALYKIYGRTVSPKSVTLASNYGGLPEPVAEAILETLTEQDISGHSNSENYPCKMLPQSLKPSDIFYALQRAGIGNITNDKLIDRVPEFLITRPWRDVLGYPLPSRDLAITLEKWFKYLENQVPTRLNKNLIHSLGLKKVDLPLHYFDIADYHVSIPYTTGVPVPWIDTNLKINGLPELNDLYGNDHQRKIRCFTAGLITRLNFDNAVDRQNPFTNLFASLRNVDIFDNVKTIESKSAVIVHREGSNIDTASFFNYVNTKTTVESLVINLSFTTNLMQRTGILGQLSIPMLSGLSEPVRRGIKTIIFDLWGLTRMIEKESCYFQMINPDLVAALLREIKKLLPNAVNFGIEDTLYWGTDYGKYTNIALVQSLVKGIDLMGAQKLLIETKNYNGILNDFPMLQKIQSIKIQAHHNVIKNPAYPMKEFQIVNLIDKLRNVENIWIKDASFSIDSQKVKSLYKSWQNSSVTSKWKKLRLSRCLPPTQGNKKRTLDLPKNQFPSLQPIITENCDIELPVSQNTLEKIIRNDPTIVADFPRDEP